jgi:hypothetical protein
MMTLWTKKAREPRKTRTRNEKRRRTKTRKRICILQFRFDGAQMTKFSGITIMTETITKRKRKLRRTKFRVKSEGDHVLVAEVEVRVRRVVPKAYIHPQARMIERSPLLKTTVRIPKREWPSQVIRIGIRNQLSQTYYFP